MFDPSYSTKTYKNLEMVVLINFVSLALQWLSISISCHLPLNSCFMHIFIKKEKENKFVRLIAPREILSINSTSS